MATLSRLTKKIHALDESIGSETAYARVKLADGTTAEGYVFGKSGTLAPLHKPFAPPVLFSDFREIPSKKSGITSLEVLVTN